MTHLEVIVRGGVLPLPIKVFINNIDNDNDLSFSRQESFSESYDLATGRYTVMVGGMNPLNGDTTITLSGDFKVGPLPQAQVVVKDSLFSVIFYIEIAV